MENKVITREQAWELIKAVVQKRGRDFRYRTPDEGRCLYVEGDAPSCGVGQIVYDLCPLPETVEFMLSIDNSELGTTLFDAAVYKFEEFLEVIFDEDATELLSDFQYQQDASKPYGWIEDYLRDRYNLE